MRLQFGNMWEWYNGYDLVLVTTNSYVKQNGDLVMGRGAALEAVSHLSNLAKGLGKIILSRKGHLGTYGLIVFPDWPRTKIGAFQVKRSFSKKAELDLIALSTDMLNAFTQQYSSAVIALNFPGIGNGGLEREDVLPIIETLSDNVHVYQYESQDGDP